MSLLLLRKRFNPRNLPNLQLWLDATRIAQADSTSVATWSDQSGNGYDATQGGSAARPTFIASGLNGLPVVRFDGTDDAMDLLSGSLGMLRNVAGATIFSVVKYAADNVRTYNLHINDSGSGQRLTSGRSSTTTKYEARGRRLDGIATQDIMSTQNVTNNFVIQSVSANYSNTLLQQYINGALDGQKTDFQTSGNTSDTNSFNISVGYLKTTSSSINYLNGDIAEVIVYNRALNTSELAQVHRYLSRKWGIALA